MGPTERSVTATPAQVHELVERRDDVVFFDALTIDDLRERGFRTVALTPAAEAPLSRAVDAEKVAFVLGAEGPGLTEHAMRAADVRARIPMAEGTDSLNVATAAAIGFYERLRF